MSQKKTKKQQKEELFAKLEEAQVKAEQAEAESMKIANQLKKIGVTKKEVEKHELETFPQFNKL